MRFGVLGPLAVWTSDGDPVTVPGLKVRALLADLLVHHGRPVSTDRLVHDLWGTWPLANPAGALQAKVSQLRRALGEAEPGGRELVALLPAGYLLRVDADAVDAHRFQALTAQTHQVRDPRAKAGLLADALALWRGPAFADFGDDEFTRSAVTRLEEQRLAVLEEQIEARLDLGEHSLLVGELGDLVIRYPLRERLRAAHLLALYRAGRQSEALAWYRELREQLVEELGLNPSPGLVALHQAILAQDPGLQVAPTRSRPFGSGAAAVGAERPQTNLPAPLNDLVGRADQVAEVQALLKSGRLVTLTGSGGVGKTRLATAAAAQLVEAFPDGVWVVEMTAIGGASGQDPRTSSVGMAKVAEVVASTLGIRDSAGEPVPPAARLADALGGRRLLLVLDNCEHVVESVAELAAFLLGSAPELRILATSREPLGVAGEVLRAVPPLDLPDPAAGGEPEVLHQSSAVRLFAARAAAAAPEFTLNAGNAHAVAAICRRLDGIPLALELAATRVRALGVHDLAARLDHRFGLLAAGYRGAPPRHQTLRAVIDWSWRLATGPERTVLRRLAVHVEGCTLEAAEQVCAAPVGKRGDAGRKDAGAGERAGDDVDAAEVLGLLARLVDRSLVAVVDGAGGLRYRLLESVSAYGIERLREAGELEEVRRRHRRYYRSLAERAVPHLRGGEQRRWLERLDAESANLRSAVDGTVRHGAAEDALRLAGALAWYWFLRGRLSEARRSLEAALAVKGDAPVAVRAAAMAWLAGVRLLSGHGTVGAAAGAGEAGDKALRLYDDISDQCGQATATWFLGFATSDFGDPSVSEALVDRALASFRAANDRWGVAAALSTRAKHAHLRGDLAGLRSNSEQSLDLFRELGDRWGQLQATEWLGALAEIVGDYQEATRLHRDGLRLAEELGLWPQVADRTSWLGRVAMLVGDYAQARQLLDRGKRLAAEQSYKPGEIFAELALGQAARREGELDVAETHLRCVLDWCRRVDLERGVASALTLAELGFVAERRGDAAAARERHLQSFTVAQRLGDRRAKALAMEGLAGAQALAGHHDHAALLLGAAAAARQEAGAPLPVTEQGDVTRATQRARATLGEEAFAAGYRRGRSLAPDDALAALGLPAPSRTTI